MTLRDVVVGAVAVDELALSNQADAIRATGTGGTLDMEVLIDQFLNDRNEEASASQGGSAFNIDKTLIIEDARFDTLRFGPNNALSDARLTLVLGREGVRGYTLNAAVPSLSLIHI